MSTTADTFEKTSGVGTTSPDEGLTTQGQNDEQRATNAMANATVQDVEAEVSAMDAEAQAPLDESNEVTAGDLSKSSAEKNKSAFQAENLLTSKRLRGYELPLELGPSQNSSAAINNYIKTSTFTPAVRRAVSTGDVRLGRPFNLDGMRTNAVTAGDTISTFSV